MAMLGWGLIVLIVFPLIGLLLAVTILGIPLAGILFLLYLLGLLVGKYFVSLTLGKYLFTKYQWSLANTWQKQFLTGLVLITLLGLLPVLGPIVKLVILIIGMGSLTVWLKTELNYRHGK